MYKRTRLSLLHDHAGAHQAEQNIVGCQGSKPGGVADHCHHAIENRKNDVAHHPGHSEQDGSQPVVLRHHIRVSVCRNRRLYDLPDIPPDINDEIITAYRKCNRCEHIKQHARRIRKTLERHLYQ